MVCQIAQVLLCFFRKLRSLTFLLTVKLLPDMKKNLQKIQVTVTLFFLIEILFLFSCHPDHNDPLIDTSNPAAVADAITIPKGTKKTGDLPPASSDSNAPKLESISAGQKTFIIQGGSLIINAPLLSGGVAGFNVKVKGSTSYFEVSGNNYSGGRLASAIGGRVKTNDNPVFSVSVPGNLKPDAEFCLQYSVFDTQKRSSNTIEICIIVKGTGGANASFLSANAWKTISSKFTNNGISTTQIIGQTYSDSVYVQAVCPKYPGTTDVTTYVKSLGASETTRIDYYYLTFSSDGKLTIDGKGYDKSLDEPSSLNSCAVKYIEDNWVENSKGAWSYDSSLKKLILIYTIIDGADAESNVDEYTVSQGDGFITLTSKDGIVLTLKPK
jgi:hypothetical protein